MSATHFWVDGKPASAQAFYGVACDPRRHVVVEACAGSGKTWMLVARMARAMLDGAPPGSLLAITFTRKAAGEMRGRLHALLQQWAELDDDALRQALRERGVASVDAATLARARGLHDEVLQALDGVQVATFHGWFASLLRHAPLEVLQSLGLPLHATLQDDDADLRRALWPAFYAHVASDESLRPVLEQGIRTLGMAAMQSALESVLPRQLEFTRAEAAGVLEASVKSVAQVFPAWSHVTDWARVLEQSPGLHQACWALCTAMGQAAKTDTARQRVQRMQQALEANDWAGVRAELLTDQGTPRKSLPAKDSGAYAELMAQVDELEQAQHQASCHAHQLRMVQLGRALLQVWRELKQQLGVIDMNDVERAAEHLLADAEVAGWIQQQLDARVKHVLIDEFQDTNPVQWHALRAWLEAYAGAGGGDAPGVFVVGDPKQSIYRFRRADARVFVQARAWLQQTHGAHMLGCDLTRRCAPQVVQVVNDGIAPLAQRMADAPEFRVHHSGRANTHEGAVWRLPLAPAPERKTSQTQTPSSWRDTLCEPMPEREDAAAQREAQTLAQWLAGVLPSQGWAPSDVLVLARQNSRLARLQEALTRHRVASAMADRTLLRDSPVVGDVAALVQACLAPHPDLALAHALRSPLFGATDAQLAALARRAQALAAQPTERWWQALQQAAPDADASDEDNATMRSWAAHLCHIAGYLQSLPPHDALVATLDRLDAVNAYAQRVPASMWASVQAQLDAVLDTALQLQEGRWLRPQDWLEHVRRSAIPHQWPTAPEAVRLMTIHGAKGLEAPVVVLMDANAGPRRAPSHETWLDWPPEDQAPRRLVFVRQSQQPPVCAADLALQQARAEAVEDLNLLYVAATRAEHHLVLSGHEVAKPQDSWYARLQALAQPAPTVPEPGAPGLAQTEVVAYRLGGEHRWPQAAQAANEPSLAQTDAGGDDARRMGQAMHRWLEGLSAHGPTEPVEPQALAQAFGLNHAQLQEVQHRVNAIRSGPAAWVWRQDRVQQEANEVDVYTASGWGRIDRLIWDVHQGCWWVLDYKSAHRPEQNEASRNQVRGYMAAVQTWFAHQTVRGALIGGNGSWSEVD